MIDDKSKDEVKENIEKNTENLNNSNLVKNNEEIVDTNVENIINTTVNTETDIAAIDDSKEEGRESFDKDSIKQENMDSLNIEKSDDPLESSSLISEKSPYKWNFSEYEKLDTKQVSSKKTGRAVLGTLTSLLVLLLAVFLIYTSVTQLTTPEKQEESSELSESSTSDLPENYKSNIEIVEHEDLDNGLSASDIFEIVSPSIVGIQTYDPEYSSTEAYSEGSGIIMSAQGEIITNSHVVFGAKSIKVTLLNGESYSATLIGEDKYTDVAVIKLNNPPENLKPAQFGDSDNLNIGDRVVAIGNPGGLEFAGSTTQGIISGLDRKVSEETGFSIKAIQVDAAINPGNSGGALINRFGQVIGITSSKISGGNFEGMGFALPIHKAQPIIDEIILNGRVPGRALIGVTYMTDKFITTELAEKYDLKTGIIVESVNETSNAFVQGILVGDIIHKIDDNVIAHLLDVTASIEDKKPGDTVTLTIYRFKEKDGPLVELIIDIVLMEDMS